MKTLLTLSLLASLTSASAAPIETKIHTQLSQTAHVSLFAQAAQGDKPAYPFFDKALPYTANNGGGYKDLEGSKISADKMGTQGPLQILYQDYKTKSLIPCGQAVAQDQNGEGLIRIDVEIQKTDKPGFVCEARGSYQAVAQATPVADAQEEMHIQR